MCQAVQWQWLVPAAASAHLLVIIIAWVSGLQLVARELPLHLLLGQPEFHLRHPANKKSSGCNKVYATRMMQQQGCRDLGHITSTCR